LKYSNIIVALLKSYIVLATSFLVGLIEGRFFPCCYHFVAQKTWSSFLCRNACQWIRQCQHINFGAKVWSLKLWDGSDISWIWHSILRVYDVRHVLWCQNASTPIASHR